MTETLSMKEIVEKAMENLPEEDTIDVAIERLLLLAKIEEGVQDLENGRTHTQEEIEGMLEGWLKQCGQTKPNLIVHHSSQILKLP